MLKIVACKSKWVTTDYEEKLKTMSDKESFNGKARDSFEKGETPTKGLGWVQQIRGGLSMGTTSFILDHCVSENLYTQLLALKAVMGGQVFFSQSRLHITVAVLCVNSVDPDLLAESAAWGKMKLRTLDLKPILLKPYKLFFSSNWDLFLTWKPVGSDPDTLFSLRKALNDTRSISAAPDLIHSSVMYAWDRDTLKENRQAVLDTVDTINAWIESHSEIVSCPTLSLVQDWTDSKNGCSPAAFLESWEQPRLQGTRPL